MWKAAVFDALSNGPTDRLEGICAGMAILAPGASPHPPHRHPEEEFLIVSDGTGEIECDGKIIQVAPGAIMYCAGNTLHGISNTGQSPITFYWSKRMVKSSRGLNGSRPERISVRATGVSPT